ncbi:undecaprenyl-diphosphate phosphatase [Kitasatospora sp. YST-16]|uniref:undecaprenyl-diphosphate phosphatase n=1 Tax=Kitasatospora sp. YST-16 TaxID=2998080 RepID=UPI00228481DE|nr:undecaprenyl-diphosphate phosphatase [Kitasatospora sp. YST-16]WAL76279.1 undecaprenyl-diphosphate phosphatase [Kitasatospora sp. YST-16]WNW42322.1 undecaprenyl-diphosphate phosphatase [Streptomyces sp. Li-HN-5-13]
MNWFHAAVLGLVQGLTEFLPVSSSAHLRVFSALAGWDDPGAAFTAVTQLGTESAVLIYFRKDIGAIIKAWTLSLFRAEWRHDQNARLGWYVIIGTLPIGILGKLFQDTIETTLRDLRLIGTTLILFGVVLAVADRSRAVRNARSIESLNFRHALIYGAAQSLALIPGVSRSGGTISAGLFLGYSREAAARYSFLLAIPAVLASGGLELLKIGEGPAPAWGPTILATLIAFAVGYAAIAWFLKYISHNSFTPFVVYRILLGITIIALVTAGTLAPDAGAVH